jgi:hypothetical protein
LISTDKGDYTTKGCRDAREEMSPRLAMENVVGIIDAYLLERKYTMNWLPYGRKQGFLLLYHHIQGVFLE